MLIFVIALLNSTGIISGEISPKSVAQIYWTKELEEELSDVGMREKWLFKENGSQTFCGNEDAAMEFVEKKRSEQLYPHNCSDHCKKKGKPNIASFFLTETGFRLLVVCIIKKLAQ